MVASTATSLRDAVRDSELYNAQWIVEKNGLSPAQARPWHLN